MRNAPFHIASLFMSGLELQFTYGGKLLKVTRSNSFGDAIAKSGLGLEDYRTFMQPPNWRALRSETDCFIEALETDTLKVKVANNHPVKYKAYAPKLGTDLDLEPTEENWIHLLTEDFQTFCNLKEPGRFRSHKITHELYTIGGLFQWNDLTPGSFDANAFSRFVTENISAIVVADKFKMHIVHAETFSVPYTIHRTHAALGFSAFCLAEYSKDAPKTDMGYDLIIGAAQQ